MDVTDFATPSPKRLKVENPSPRDDTSPKSIESTKTNQANQESSISAIPGLGNFDVQSLNSQERDCQDVQPSLRLTLEPQKLEDAETKEDFHTMPASSNVNGSSQVPDQQARDPAAGEHLGEDENLTTRGTASYAAASAHRDSPLHHLEQTTSDNPKDPLTLNAQDPTVAEQPTLKAAQVTTSSVEEAEAKNKLDCDSATNANSALDSGFDGAAEGLTPGLRGFEATNITNGDAEFEEDSSPYSSSESDSEASHGSASSTKTLEGEYQTMDLEEQARALMAEDGNPTDGQHADGGKIGKSVVRSMNEKPDEPSHIPDIQITDAMKLEELGQVTNIVGTDVVIKAKTSGEYRVLDFGSLLCLKDKQVIGVVSETLGKVQQPFYTVRFPSQETLSQTGLTEKTAVFYVHEHSNYIFTKPLEGLKGTDASNFYDEEVGDDEMEFSDDEAEAEHRRRKKAELRAKKEGRPSNAEGYSRGPGGRRGRGNRGKREGQLGQSRVQRLPPVPSDVPSASGSLDYDDGPSSELYTPLARPTNPAGMNNTQASSINQPHNGRSPNQHAAGARGRGGRNHYNHSERGAVSSRGFLDAGRNIQPNGYGQPSMPYDTAHSPIHSNTDLTYPVQPTQPSVPNGVQHTFHVPPYGQNQYQQPGHNAWQQMMQMAGYPSVAQAQFSPVSSQPHTSPGNPPFIPAGSHVNPAFFRPPSQGSNLPQWQQNHQQHHQR